MSAIKTDRAYALAAKRVEVARRIGDPMSPEGHAYLDRMLFQSRQPKYDALVDGAVAHRTAELNRLLYLTAGMGSNTKEKYRKAHIEGCSICAPLAALDREEP